MKILLALLFIVSSLPSFAGNAYPQGPDLKLTPGSLCDSPSEYRYPERIPYCMRDLDSYSKELIFIAYRKLGYSLSGQRNEYKVDHFIPLCAGGSNHENNLWPQYYTISAITDPLEPLGCEVLAMGKIRQKDLVAIIIKAKRNLREVPAAIKYLRSLKQR